MLDDMLAASAHRGPDGRGVWSDGGDGCGPVHLGHVRLAIVDPSERGAQPFVTPDGRGVLTYNGEVYNAPALRARLEEEGARFVSTGDTEVVLTALHRWGPRKAVPLFDGMFALAYWDGRERALWLARDRLGIKPLYLARPEGVRVAFASEPKALLARPDVTARPHAAVIAEYLAEGLITGVDTPFEGITALPPGSLLRVGEDGERSHVWFDLVSRLDVERVLAGARRPAAQSIREFESLFDASVAMHLMSDVPVAVLCSGGVDSSYVAAVASDHHPNLTGYIGDVRSDPLEGQYGREVGRHLGLPFTSVPFDREDMLSNWVRATVSLDQPCFHPSDMAFLRLADRCRADGIKVALTGEGADEMFAGYIPFGQTRRLWRRWRRGRPRLARWLPDRRPLPLPTREMFGHWGLHEPSIPGWPDPPAASVERHRVRNTALFAALAGVTPVEDRAFLTHCVASFGQSLEGLLHRLDRTGMAASVEMRVPFLENALIDHAMHLPKDMKRRGRMRKFVLKQAAEQRVPAAIVHAPKRAFPVAYDWSTGGEALFEDGALGEVLGWSRADAAQAVAACRSGRIDPRSVFKLVSTELWARLALRDEAPADVTAELLERVSRSSGA